jgi:hypothetical protein
VGALMAVASVLGRELLGALFPDTRIFYVVSILIVYAVGSFVGFLLQEAYTFARVPASQRRISVIAFYAVAASVGILTAGFAYVLRYALAFEDIFSPYGAAAAFACSALVMSVLSYYLSARFVFAPDIARSRGT